MADVGPEAKKRPRRSSRLERRRIADDLGDFQLRLIFQWCLDEETRDVVFDVCKAWRDNYKWINPPRAYQKSLQAKNIAFANILWDTTCTIGYSLELFKTAAQYAPLNHFEFFYVRYFVSTRQWYSRVALEESMRCGNADVARFLLQRCPLSVLKNKAMRITLMRCAFCFSSNPKTVAVCLDDERFDYTEYFDDFRHFDLGRRKIVWALAEHPRVDNVRLLEYLLGRVLQPWHLRVVVKFCRKYKPTLPFRRVGVLLVKKLVYFGHYHGYDPAFTQYVLKNIEEKERLGADLIGLLEAGDLVGARPLMNRFWDM